MTVLDAEHPPHESPPLMTVPLLILAVLAIIGGFIFIPLHGLETLADWLEPVFATTPEIEAPSFVGGLALTALSVFVGLVGLVLAARLYRRGLPTPADDPVLQRLGRFGRVFGSAYYFDEGVSRLVGGPLRRVASWLSDTFDARGVDGAVNGVGGLVRRGSESIRKAQSGLVRNYALVDRHRCRRAPPLPAPLRGSLT